MYPHQVMSIHSAQTMTKLQKIDLNLGRRIIMNKGTTIVSNNETKAIVSIVTVVMIVMEEVVILIAMEPTDHLIEMEEVTIHLVVTKREAIPSKRMQKTILLAETVGMRDLIIEMVPTIHLVEIQEAETVETIDLIEEAIGSIEMEAMIGSIEVKETIGIIEMEETIALIETVGTLDLIETVVMIDSVETVGTIGSIEMETIGSIEAGEVIDSIKMEAIMKEIISEMVEDIIRFHKMTIIEMIEIEETNFPRETLVIMNLHLLKEVVNEVRKVVTKEGMTGTTNLIASINLEMMMDSSPGIMVCLLFIILCKLNTICKKWKIYFSILDDNSGSNFKPKYGRDNVYNEVRFIFNHNLYRVAKNQENVRELNEKYWKVFVIEAL